MFSLVEFIILFQTNCRTRKEIDVTKDINVIIINLFDFVRDLFLTCLISNDKINFKIIIIFEFYYVKNYLYLC